MLKSTKVYKFYEQVKQEARKLVWPTHKELIIFTSIVLLAVLVCSLIFLFLDYGIHSIIQMLLGIGN